MPRIEKTMTRVRLPQAEGAPHSRSLSNYIETPQTPRPKLSLENPDNIDLRSGLTCQMVLNDRPEYDDDAANKSRKDDRKEILREMAISQDPYEKLLGQAILIRITLEEQKADLVSKPNFDEDDKYDLENLEKKIDHAKTREKLLDEDYKRHIRDEIKDAKQIQNYNSNLITDTIYDLLKRSGYLNIKLTSKTSSLYSYLMEFYESHFKEKFGPNFFESRVLTDSDMYNATNYVLSQLDKETFMNKLANAKKGGSSTKKRKNVKRGYKRNRKSMHQRK